MILCLLRYSDFLCLQWEILVSLYVMYSMNKIANMSDGLHIMIIII